MTDQHEHCADQHLCPECWEPARDRAPIFGVGVGPMPPWSHAHDGTPLCTVMGRDGYDYAEPVAVTDVGLTDWQLATFAGLVLNYGPIDPDCPVADLIGWVDVVNAATDGDMAWATPSHVVAYVNATFVADGGR